MSKIKYINRETNEFEEEKVFGEKYLQWLYTSPLGMGLLELIFKKGIFSCLYGKLQDSFRSKKKIPSFIKDYEIDMSEFEKEVSEYTSFNDFFYRKLKKGARFLDERENRLVSPADGRLLAYKNIDINALIQVKGSTYTLAELINNKALAQTYDQGFCIVIRLCPTDYHRFHFPDYGIPEKFQRVKGHYYSVNPIALKTKAQIYCQNKREITIFHSANFGDILLLEIGATCVGSIVQTFIPDQPVSKGEEKGYFKFGGSTVIMFLKKGELKLDQDLLYNTKQGYETKVKMGMGIGTSLKE